LTPSVPSPPGTTAAHSTSRIIVSTDFADPYGSAIALKNLILRPSRRPGPNRMMALAQGITQRIPAQRLKSGSLMEAAATRRTTFHRKDCSDHES
jgi:hypothetical protein